MNVGGGGRLRSSVGSVLSTSLGRSNTRKQTITRCQRRYRSRYRSHLVCVAIQVQCSRSLEKSKVQEFSVSSLLKKARHAPFYDWMGVVTTCSVSEATDGRRRRRQGGGCRRPRWTIVMNFHEKIIRIRRGRETNNGSEISLAFRERLMHVYRIAPVCLPATSAVCLDHQTRRRARVLFVQCTCPLNHQPTKHGSSQDLVRHNGRSRWVLMLKGVPE